MRRGSRTLIAQHQWLQGCLNNIVQTFAVRENQVGEMHCSARRKMTPFEPELCGE